MAHWLNKLWLNTRLYWFKTLHIERSRPKELHRSHLQLGDIKVASTREKYIPPKKSFRMRDGRSFSQGTSASSCSAFKMVFRARRRARFA